MIHPLCPSSLQAKTQSTVETPAPLASPQECLSRVVRIQSPFKKNSDQCPSLENSVQSCHRLENPLNRETEGLQEVTEKSVPRQKNGGRRMVRRSFTALAFPPTCIHLSWNQLQVESNSVDLCARAVCHLPAGSRRRFPE